MILFNKVITATFTSTDHKDIPAMVIGDNETITMGTGVRPALALSLDMIPGMYCFNGSLQVVNLPSSTDITVYDKVTIRAGYTPNKDELNTVTFEGDVFSSYTVSPPPDSVTVFNFILLTTVYGVVKQDNKFEINWGAYATKYEALSDIFAALQLSWDTDSKSTDEILQDPKRFISNSVSNSFSSVNALLTFLNKDLEGINCACFYNPTDKIVHVYSTSPSVPPDQDKVAHILTLQGVSSINFNAAMLTVQSPWVPGLRPGYYIKLNSMFYNGEQLPNAAKKNESFKGIDDLYKVLTIRLTFSNTEATNNMVITAVPVKEQRTEKAAITNVAIGYDPNVKGPPLLTIPEDVAADTRKYGVYKSYFTFTGVRFLQDVLREVTKKSGYPLPPYILPISEAVSDRIEDELVVGDSILRDMYWEKRVEVDDPLFRAVIEGSILTYAPSFTLNSPSKDSPTPTTPVYFDYAAGCFSINNQQQRRMGHDVLLPQPCEGQTIGNIRDWMEKYTVPYLSVYEEILFGNTPLFKHNQDSLLQVYALYRLSGGERIKTSYTNQW